MSKTDHGRGENRRVPGSRRLVIHCLCSEPGSFHETYDSFYCPKSGVWLEPLCKCNQDDCPMIGRPVTAL